MPSSDETKCEKGYSLLDSKQIHWRRWTSGDDRDVPNLICLHPAPLSGLAFQNLAPILAKRRHVLAPDLPGYGSSGPMPSPSIADYAALVAKFIEASRSNDLPVDLLGFHSGCLIAAELAIQRPELAGKIIMIDVPAFDPEGIEAMAEKFAQPFAPPDDLAGLEKPWAMSFVKRIEPQGREQAFSVFVEQLRSGVHMNEAYSAAFAYDWQDRFKLVDTDTLVLASQSNLLEGSRKTASIIANARLKECLSITRSVLDEAASQVAGIVDEFLDE